MDAIQYRTHHLSDEDADRVGTLEQLSEQRQQRLEQLKRETFARQCEIASSSYSSSSGDQIPLPKPKFRSYNPNDTGLKENKLSKIEPESIEDHINEQLIALKDSNVINDVDLSTLAPRKIDWDLKRNIESKLQKLDKRTDKAINELIRAKLDKVFEQQ